MKARTLLSVMVLLGSSASYANKPEPLPADVAQALAGKSLKTVVTFSKCEWAEKKLEAFAIVVSQGDQLVPVIATKSGGQVNVQTLSTDVRGPFGFVRHYFSEYSAKDAPQVLCENPAKSEELYPQLGYVMGGEKMGTGNHICFGASTIYSNWVCYLPDSKTGSAALSYVQMNAD